MNQHQMIDQLKAEFRQIIEARLERPIEQINRRLSLIEETLQHMDDQIKGLDAKLNRIDAKLEQHDGRFHDVLEGQREIQERLWIKP